MLGVYARTYEREWMSVSEALRAGLVMKVKSRAPRRSAWSFVRFVVLCPADDAESSSRSHSADRNKQFARRGYWVTRMSAGSRLALISLLDFARMTSLEKGKGTHIENVSSLLWSPTRWNLPFLVFLSSLGRSLCMRNPLRGKSNMTKWYNAMKLIFILSLKTCCVVAYLKNTFFRFVSHCPPCHFLK